MRIFRDRRYAGILFILYISTLALILFTISQLPNHPITSGLILQNTDIRKDVIMNRPSENVSTLYEPSHAFLFNPEFFVWLELQLSSIGHFFRINLSLAALVLVMFYLFFRLSRTDEDPFAPIN